jgi:hypothetical protein
MFPERSHPHFSAAVDKCLAPHPNPLWAIIEVGRGYGAKYQTPAQNRQPRAIAADHAVSLKLGEKRR